MYSIEQEIRTIRALADMMMQKALSLEKHVSGEKKPRKKKGGLSEQQKMAIRTQLRKNLPAREKVN